MNQNIPPKLRPFYCHGVKFVSQMGNEAIAKCPFCSRRKHFYVNMKTGQFCCKSCGEGGNIYSFLKKYSDMIYQETTIAEYKELRKLRGLPVQLFRNWKFGWDGECWLMPVWKEGKKTCLDIRRWNPKTNIVKSTAGCNLQLYGMYKAKEASTIWLCEGEWDTIAMSMILEQAGLSDRAVGVPGANTFKEDWPELFKGKTVYLCYDNDNPGVDGMMRTYDKLKPVVRSIKHIKWPTTYPKGYDVRDCVLEFKTKALTKLRKSLIIKTKRKTTKKKISKVKARRKRAMPDFEQTLAVFKRHARMKPDLVDALRVMFAVAFSSSEQREPLWIYIVGPSGCGKTMLLEAFDNNEAYCKYVSTISTHGLVSGFKAKKDPSLLPQLRDRCLIWKDFTELLTKKAYDKPEIYSTLRGAYDGQVYKMFGNGVIREYKDLYFSMLAGVTPAIHGDSQAMMGERFLKYELFKNIEASSDEQITAALAQTSKEERKVHAMQLAAKKFLETPLYEVRAPKWVTRRLTALVQLIAALRTAVEREEYGDRNIRYKPSPEIGTRLAKQLFKLAKFLCIVDGDRIVGMKQYTLIERVAFDTSDKLHLEIAHAIGEDEVELADIVNAVGLSYSNIRRQLEDMQAAKVVEKIGKRPALWRLTKRVADLWKRSEIKRVKL